MTGILMAMGGLGSLIAAAPLAWVSNLIGWRMSFVAVGILTLVLAVLVWFFVRDKPQDMGFEPPMGPPKVKPEAIGLMQGVAKVVKEPFFWPVAVWFFFDCAVFFSFGGLWGGPYLIQVYGMSKGEAGRILSMLAIGMIVGSPLLSYASNRVFKGRKPVLILSSTILVALTAVLAFATASIPTVGLYAVCLGLGVFSSAVVVIGFITTKELFPVQMAGTATGLVNLFPFAGGAVFQPLLGYVLEKGGQGVGGAFTLAAYRQAFLVLFVCGVIAFLASLFTRETLARQ